MVIWWWYNNDITYWDIDGNLSCGNWLNDNWEYHDYIYSSTYWDIPIKSWYSH